MKQTIKEKISIPEYSLGEELMNAITGNAWAVVASAIYGASLIILYMMSTMYHSLKVNNAKRVFRILDHCTIYFLIAGTYTPYTLVSLNGPVGWTLFGIVWGAAILGIVFNAVNINRFKIISYIAYIAMGWVIIFAFRPLYEVIGFGGVAWLLGGGVAYTVGAVFYAFGKKCRYIHSVFHIFVVAGSILQYFCILFYVL